MSLWLLDSSVLEGKIAITYDSDAIDRLRYFSTVVVLTASALFIMAKQYVGESVQCWLPKQFANGWESYAETYCLIENTYFVNMNESNLPDTHTRENSELRYYQWVPFILFGMAFALYLPRIVWKLLQSVIGVDISIVTSCLRHNAMEQLEDLNVDLEEKRKDIVVKKKKFQSRSTGEFWGSRLTICVLITKILATVVIIASMIFMDYFMGIGPFFGWTVTMDVLAGRQWQESGTFPRVTFCDFQVRELGFVNNWSLQCVLMVNMFNEKLFIALWWWYTILTILSIYDIFRFFFRFTTRYQINFIEDILTDNVDPNVTKSEVSEFNRRVLKNDGINLIHLIYANATVFEAGEFLRPLWNNFKNRN